MYRERERERERALPSYIMWQDDLNYWLENQNVNANQFFTFKQILLIINLKEEEEEKKSFCFLFICVSFGILAFKRFPVHLNIHHLYTCAVSVAHLFARSFERGTNENKKNYVSLQCKTILKNEIEKRGEEWRDRKNNEFL